MSGSLLAYLGMVALAALLPVVALGRRRLPLKTIAKMSLAWVAIFVVVMLLFSGLGR